MSTDRKEIENLAHALRAKGYTVEVSDDHEGRLESVLVYSPDKTAGCRFSPLAFAEYARPKVATAPEMTPAEAIEIARKHLDNGAVMASSAKLCLLDAVALMGSYDYEGAKRRALKSLAYSVGIFHADYQRVKAGLK